MYVNVCTLHEAGSHACLVQHVLAYAGRVPGIF